jgi:hypothetical protein
MPWDVRRVVYAPSSQLHCQPKPAAKQAVEFVIAIFTSFSQSVSQSVITTLLPTEHMVPTHSDLLYERAMESQHLVQKKMLGEIEKLKSDKKEASIRKVFQNCFRTRS